MKIETEVTITDTVEIHISADEAIGAILQNPEAGYKLLNLLSGIGTSMRAIPDEMIADMNPEQKKITADFLTEQSARFVT